VQEALSNVVRHAQATRVEVTVEARAGDLTLRVSDNGRGIHPAELADPQSLGLLGMRERVMLLAGEFKLDSAPGQGTTIQVRTPLPG
jgi:signal transduction histidine kinase